MQKSEALTEKGEKEKSNQGNDQTDSEGMKI